jgi:hypothetical protein
VLIGIDSLGFVISIGFDDEPVIRMDVSRAFRSCLGQDLQFLPCLITRMMTRSNPIDIASSCSPSKCVPIILGSRGKGKVHEMGDGGLASATIGIPYSSLVLLVRDIKLFLLVPYGFRHDILIRKSWLS